MKKFLLLDRIAGSNFSTVTISSNECIKKLDFNKMLAQSKN